MNKEDFIKKFISSYEIEAGRYSCLIIALIDARRLTGRNIDSGFYEQNILTAKNTFYAVVGVQITNFFFYGSPHQQPLPAGRQGSKGVFTLPTICKKWNLMRDPIGDKIISIWTLQESH
jgi:hypothetical protein